LQKQHHTRMDIAFRKHVAHLLGIRLWMNSQVVDFTPDTKRKKLFDLNYQ
jgi:hypothetical protein